MATLFTVWNGIILKKGNGKSSHTCPSMHYQFHSTVNVYLVLEGPYLQLAPESEENYL